MDDRMTAEQVDDLLALIQSSASVDSKVHQVTAVKASIKHCNVPDQCVATLFEALRLASSNPHSSLANAGFTTLNHLVTRMSLQEPRYLNKEARHTLPLIVDRLGDQKEKVRALAAHALTTMFPHASVDIERFIKNTAMAGKSARAKEASMHWVRQMHNEHGMQFRAYVPALMELLEDADAGVRDVAKGTVIELFRNAPGAAKADLKKQLKTFKVRPAIENAIVKEMGPPAAAAASSAAPSAVPGPRSHTPIEPAPMSRSAVNLSASVSSFAGSERPITPGPDGRSEPAEPIFINTSRELEDIFRQMGGYFDGRETEHNWLRREESASKLRGLIAGNAAIDYHDHFVQGLRALLDGIIKAVNSLRTSLSKEGCALVQDMAMNLGPSMDPMVELLMQNFVKLAASTKKIAAAQANATVDAIIGRVTYTNRLMQHITFAMEDKNVQPRLFSAGWLTTLLRKETGHRGHLEHSGGVDMMEKSLKKAINDPNPGVREKMRGAYWVYAGIWPGRAEMLMEGLDAQAQKLLKKDPGNPNGAKLEPTARPGLGLSKSTMGTGKPSLRETMMAQKQASLGSRKVPPRPGSAMSHLERNTTNAAAAAAAAATSAPSSSTSSLRGKPENSGGMSGAPMRPARRRPEVQARPATAGPYSVRSQELIDDTSPPPSNRVPRSMTPKPVETSPKRTAPRSRPGHASTLSESSSAGGGGSPMRPRMSKQVASPTASPRLAAAPFTPRLKMSRSTGPGTTSPTLSSEDLTLLVPTIPSIPQVLQPTHVEDEQHERESTPESAPAEEPEPMAMADDTTESHSMVESYTPTTEAPPMQIPMQVSVQAPVQTEATAREPTHDVSSNTPDGTPKKVQVYEDPVSEQERRSPLSPVGISTPVLENKSINENAGNMFRPLENGGGGMLSPDKAKQNARLMESGIAKIRTKSLDVHSFRKLQSLMRENKVSWTDSKLDAMVTGLFGYLEDPLADLKPAKALDVKTQILATVRVLLKKERAGFQPHVAAGLVAVIGARSTCQNRSHIVSGLDMLAEELVSLGDAPDMVMVLTQRLGGCTDTTVEGCRVLSAGMLVLRSVLDRHGGAGAYEPADVEVDRLADLARRGIESADSGVRKDSVDLCVALHARIGEQAFWDALKNTREDPKNLISYYIARRRQEAAAGIMA